MDLTLKEAVLSVIGIPIDEWRRKKKLEKSLALLPAELDSKLKEVQSRYETNSKLSNIFDFLRSPVTKSILQSSFSYKRLQKEIKKHGLEALEEKLLQDLAEIITIVNANLPEKTYRILLGNLLEINRKLPDRVQERKPKPNCVIPPQELKIPQIYKGWIEDHCKYMALEELVDDRNSIPVDLLEVFIPLYTNPPHKAGELESGQTVINLETLISKELHLLIKGDPGSGKTTLLKHLAYTITKGKAGFEDWLPVLVFLKDPLDRKDKKKERRNPGVETAEMYLTEYFRHRLSIELIKGYCEIGKAIFLIDGLDEIEPDKKQLLVESFKEFWRKYDKCKLVLSGRPHALDNPTVNQFDTVAEIHPLNQEQREVLINKWYRFAAVHDEKVDESLAAELIREIGNHESLGEMIDTPLMLTAICILYSEEQRLPEQRAELYNRFINRHINKQFTNRYSVKADYVRELLMTLAFTSHKERTRGFGKSSAIKVMKTLFKQEADETKFGYGQRIINDFQNIEQCCGLFKLENGMYDFRHQTFQEFLTACYIENSEDDYKKALKGYWENDWYQEIVKLFIGYLSIDDSEQANELVRDKLSRPDVSPFVNWRLASEALQEILKANRKDEVVQRAQKQLQEIFIKEKSPKIRAATGEILGWLGDPRDLREFVEVEAGKYNLEGLGEFELKEDFWLGKYPVTNCWYEEFIRVGGYETPNYWTPEGKKWLVEKKVKLPAYWHNRKWKCPNAPVVGVSWYEAAAFCTWLTEAQKDGYTYRLPTEQEWQAVAAGQENRQYPWGAWQENYCNCGKSEIGKTSSVGIFPAGNTPGTEIADLSGNVWEWTKTERESKRNYDDFPLYEIRSLKSPTYRGGALNLLDCSNLRCTSRFGSTTYDRSTNIGFRCAKMRV